MAKKASKPSTAKMVEAVEMLRQHRTGVILTGHVKDGKVILDKACLEQISKQFPDGNVAFVAVNAPFDPQSQLVGSEV